jgi:hypothetical protein
MEEQVTTDLRQVVIRDAMSHVQGRRMVEEMQRLMALSPQEVLLEKGCMLLVRTSVLVGFEITLMRRPYVTVAILCLTLFLRGCRDVGGECYWLRRPDAAGLILCLVV